MSTIIFKTKLDPLEASLSAPRFDDRCRAAMAARDQSAGLAGQAVDTMLQDVPVFQQLGNSCIGEAMAQCYGAVSAVQGNRRIYSALASYYFARLEEAKLKVAWGEEPSEVDPYALPDDGTFPYAAFVACQVHGIPYEDDWPHDSTLIDKPPGWGAVAEGSAHKSTAFYRIDSTGNQLMADIESCIRANHPVQASIPVDVPMWTHVGGEPLGLRCGPMLGMHRIPILGIDGSGRPIVVNSWGPHWGDGGLCYIMPEFVITQFKDIYMFAPETIV